MAAHDEENKNLELDPIKASYDIYIKPTLSNGRKLYVLQFPNRPSNQPYVDAQGSKPVELRMKPNSGLMELDVPLDTFRNYDREKGVKWGDALKQSNATKGGITYGLPGGFGIGGQTAGRGRGRPVKDEPENLTSITDQSFTAMLNQQRVMTKQTLGGQAVPVEPFGPRYMIGAFRKNQLHLTPISQIVQLRPQFHHIDAKVDMERQSRPRDSAAGPPAAARAIHMTAKSTVDGEESNVDTMIERIRQAQEEPWRKLRYVDENSSEAWTSFEELFVNTNAGDAAAEGENDAAVEELPGLRSSLSNAQYLDTIIASREDSRPKKKRRTRKPKGKAREGNDGFESAVTSTDDEDVVMETVA